MRHSTITTVTVLHLCLSIPISLCRPIQDTVSLDVPFGNLLGVQELQLGAGSPGASPINIKLPFSDFNMPDFGLGGLLKPGSVPLPEKPLVGIKPSRLPSDKPPLTDPAKRKGLKCVPRASNRDSAAAFVSDRSSNAVPISPSLEPVSQINLPFSRFDLPLTDIEVGKPNQLPPGVQQKIQAQRQKEAQLNTTGDPFISQIALQGNLATALHSKIPGQGKQAPNKGALPLSVLELPLHLVDLPYSKFLLPFARANNFGGLNFDSAAQLVNDPLLGYSAVDLLRSSHDPTFTQQYKAEQKQRRKRQTSLVDDDDRCEPNDLVCQAQVALAPQIENIDINSLSLPYSFLNTPLAFFNTPLSYLNLPYGSFNLPFGHINLPFGFNNLPFFEMIETFGGAAAAPFFTRQFDPDTGNESTNLNFTAVFPSLYNGSLLPPIEVSTTTALPEREIVECYWETDTNQAHSDTDTDDYPTPQAPNSADTFNSLLSDLKTAAGSKDGDAAVAASLLDQPIEGPSQAFSFANQFIRTFTKGDTKTAFGTQTQAKQSVDKLLRQTVPGIADVASLGLFGTPNSLFTTPFSLFTLPLGFLDEPLAFLNMPFSHFNLPLSHLTLPFSGFSLPTQDIVEPEIYQSVDNSTVELADIPPSLLEILDPDDPLQSYLNLPLSEVDLPLAVMDMPFTVFDMPFAFMNMPLSHFNNPFTHLHLPFEISSLPFAELGLPFAGLLGL